MPFVRLMEVNEISTDPVPWGTNWPHQFDGYRRTVDTVETQYGGSSAMPESRLDAHPWLRRLYAGYAFSIDYREARGHAYMLFDQEVTERVTKRTQSGACLHCHSSIIPTYRRLGLEQSGERADAGAKVYKAQHPEFELWSQGVHARSGVSCADCHMPYERRGAMKVSSHGVRSPLLNINNACQTCHNVPEDELREKVATIQGRTVGLIERAAAAMTDMLDAILAAKAADATREQLAPIYALQKKAMWRLDFISSENSDGFHADQEAVRILAESIDYSRQAQSAALRLRAPAAKRFDQEPEPVLGVTPTEKAPNRPPPER